MSLYSQRGVSAQKEDVHIATKHLDKGLYPRAFCRIYDDVLCGDGGWVNVMHADGAGSKSILAYLYWKQTGDVSVWESIAQDAIVMNMDDLLCVGIYDNILFSSTIDRNKNLIPTDVLEALINGHQVFFNKMKTFGINIHYMGGETADVGDVVRTIAVNGTMTARWRKSKLITNEKVKAGDMIVGLASYGKTNYESEYNSGIGSNGLTSARHDLLEKTYAANFPETYDHLMAEEVVYCGPHSLSNEFPVSEHGQAESSTNSPDPLSTSKLTIGKLLLSPTRTYAPLVKELLENNFNSIHGLIHCSGGGQTKCLKYMPANVRIIKDNLFEPPPIFSLIQHASKANDREMYQVFNMGCRMEVYTNQNDADLIIAKARQFNLAAQVIGRVEEAQGKQLVIKTKNSEQLFES